ncbi:MAG: hypothetical protein K2L96_05125 [Muribaculaceae bacterium]|nr:hypothetical protein [Muribaculaceae bacterium]
MKIQNRIHVYAACALTLLLGAAASSCSTQNEKEACTKNCEAEDTRIAFKTFDEEQTYTIPGTDTLFSMDHNATFTAKASLMMPTSIEDADVAVLREAIMNAATGGQVSKPCEKAVEAYFKSVADSLGYGAVEEAKEDVGIMEADGFMNISGTVASLSPRVLSYAVASYTYPVHAANGESVISYVNYDFTAKKVMNLDDVFTAEGIKELPAVIAERVKQTNADAEVTALPQTGSYYVDYEGRIVFVYQQGEVSSMAAGAVTAAFYPQELSQYMTPAGKAFLE